MVDVLGRVGVPVPFANVEGQQGLILVSLCLGDQALKVIG